MVLSDREGQRRCVRGERLSSESLLLNPWLPEKCEGVKIQVPGAREVCQAEERLRSPGWKCILPW